MRDRFQINKNLLTIKIKLKGATNTELARAMGITPALLSMKLRGESRFKDYHIAAIRDFLDLTADEVMEIFYTGVVFTNDGIKRVSVMHELDLYIQIITKGHLETRSTIDQVITGYVIQGVITQWVENPQQSTFTFPINSVDMAQKYKLFALSDIMVHKFNPKKHTDTYAKLFESVSINTEKKTITLTIDNNKLRNL